MPSVICANVGEMAQVSNAVREFGVGRHTLPWVMTLTDVSEGEGRSARLRRVLRPSSSSSFYIPTLSDVTGDQALGNEYVRDEWV